MFVMAQEASDDSAADINLTKGFLRSMVCCGQSPGAGLADWLRSIALETLVQHAAGWPRRALGRRMCARSGCAWMGPTAIRPSPPLIVASPGPQAIMAPVSSTTTVSPIQRSNGNGYIFTQPPALYDAVTEVEFIAFCTLIGLLVFALVAYTVAFGCRKNHIPAEKEKLQILSGKVVLDLNSNDES
uniref:FXYD domain-containing ion transport regulator n=1 Tax=Panagrellus redivivus TaxID=6233 RepID=A0A7E4ZQZ0_PANRE